MDYAWIEPTLGRISDLLQMPAIHNSYATPKVSPECAWSAVQLIWGRMGPLAPAPCVTPTGKGGLCLEWHGIQTECRLTADPDGIKIVSGHRGTVLIETLGSNDKSGHLSSALKEILTELGTDTASLPAR